MKQKVLNWLHPFSTFCFFDNHQYRLQPHTEECLAAAGVRRKLRVNAGNALQQLESFCKENKNWVFGHLSYDIKNEIESLYSAKADHIGFPDLFFFEPEVLIRLSADEISVTAEEPEKVYKEILIRDIPIVQRFNSIDIKSRFSKNEYVATIDRLKQHIVRGDCYEINFCQEFYAENVSIDPLAVYNKLCCLSPNPFSALYRVDDKWLICASPERFLKKTGDSLLSQPMKGTAKRSTGDEYSEALQKLQLQKSTKDQSENVMVVDLVRNDLSKICREGTVKVDELFGVYAFPRVYQMISTVSGKLKNSVGLSAIFRATFPMGSMTGAPKKKVMQLIEANEKTKRGIFSGTVGYINPEGDFDFNVVIRSIMFNAGNKYLSFQAGSGITFYSEAENEWEECLLKAEAIKEVLEGR
jgi:para-aminobenzoate synthetase component 1